VKPIIAFKHCGLLGTLKERMNVNNIIEKKCHKVCEHLALRFVTTARKVVETSGAGS